MPTWIDNIKDVLLIAGGITALVTFIVSVIEYRRQGRTKRVELYLQLEQRLIDNPEFSEIRKKLCNQDESIKDIDHKLRADYAGFFETIALLTQSGFMKPEIACHMFSWDAITCWESDDFWQDFDKGDEYWGVLRHFVEDMKVCRPRIKSSSKKFKF